MPPVENESFWLQAIEREGLEPPLEGEHHVDVVCVGGGYTSLVTAYLLKKKDPGLKVAVLESRYVGFGSSGRNGGMVLHEPHLDRLRARGADAVRFTFEETVRSVDVIAELARDAGFDCELERVGYLDIALNAQHERENEAKQEACERIGIALQLVDREAMARTIQSERFRSALRYPRAATLHPGKYVAGLKRAALARGVALFERSPVEAVEETANGVHVRTASGLVRAQRAVIGLNAYLPTGGLGPLRPRAVALFSFILLTEPLVPEHWEAIGWRGREGYSDKRRVHNYVRLTGDRILFGGRVRYRFGLESPAAIESIYARLREELDGTFPCLQGVQVTHRWCGPVAITWSRRPFLYRSGRVLAALGYSGLGVSLATLCGRVLADLAVDDSERWEGLLYLKDRMARLPPEPLRWLGFESGYLGMRLLDFLDRLRSRG